MLFLSSDLRIRHVTPRLQALFNFASADLSHSLIKQPVVLGYDELLADARHVLDRAESTERVVTDQHDRHFLVRGVAYRADEERSGVFFTFTDITPQQRAAAAEREGKEEYHQFFHAIDEGFCICEMLINEENQPYDYRFLEVNPLFEEHSGLEEAEGKTALTLIPNLEAHWIETYGTVALQRKPTRFEQGSAALGRWFDVYAFPIGEPTKLRFAITFKDITQQKQAEDARRESEARFRGFADTAPALLWATDPGGQCTYLSKSWYDFTGQTPETGLGVGWINALHPDDQARAGADFLRANEQRSSFRLDYRFRRHDGEYRWAIDAGQPYFGEDGTFRGYVGSVTDIHDRTLAEEALRQANEEVARQQRQLHEFFQQAPVAITTFRGPEYIFELANPPALEIWGKPAEEVVNRPLFEVIPELNDQGFKERLDEVLYRGNPFVGHEVPMVSTRPGNTETRHYDVVYHPWRNGAGEITGVMVVSTDVSERVAARQQEHRLTALIKNSSDFIGLASPEGEVQYLNPAARAMVGLEPSRPLSELAIVDFFQEDDLPFVQQTILPITLADGKWVGEYRFRHFSTGQAVPVYYNLFSVKDPTTDKLLGIATISTDITRRKQREAELQQAREQLAAANEELTVTNEELITSNEELIDTNELLKRVNADLDNFVYTASHDLKAPITNIEGLLQLLRSSLSPDSRASPRTQKVLSMMGASVTRFMNTIADLSEIARLQKQANQPTEWVDLSAVIEEVCLDIAPAIEEARAQIDVQVAACGPVSFAPKNLRSIIYNLLSNAVKYRDPQRAPVVRIRCQVVDEYQVFTVADNGLGMDLSRSDKLFSMFQRFHDHVEGTGVGLYIVKKIIENSGGKISVTSEVGEGTTFTVFFKR